MTVEHGDHRVDVVGPGEGEHVAIQLRRKGADVVDRAVLGAHDERALHRDLRPREPKTPGELANTEPR